MAVSLCYHGCHGCSLCYYGCRDCLFCYYGSNGFRVVIMLTLLLGLLLRLSWLCYIGCHSCLDCYHAYNIVRVATTSLSWVITVTGVVIKVV